jgi:hypothetical protein
LARLPFLNVPSSLLGSSSRAEELDEKLRIAKH